MTLYDPLHIWRETLVRELTSKGYQIATSGIPDAREGHPYILYHPTSPKKTSHVPTQFTGKKLRRAVERAYKTDYLMPWVPFWMRIALFPSLDPDEPVHYHPVRRADIFRYRYGGEQERIALDALARLGGAEAIWTVVRTWVAETRKTGT